MWYRGFFHQPIALMTEAASSPLPAPISITSARSEDLFCRIQRATATAKLFNFASNIASLGVFVFGGKVIWLIGGIMIGGQIIGARLGALAVNTGGEKLIRPMIIFVSLAMLAKYVLQKAAMAY